MTAAPTGSTSPGWGLKTPASAVGSGGAPVRWCPHEPTLAGPQSYGQRWKRVFAPAPQTTTRCPGGERSGKIGNPRDPRGNPRKRSKRRAAGKVQRYAEPSRKRSSTKRSSSWKKSNHGANLPSAPWRASAFKYAARESRAARAGKLEGEGERKRSGTAGPGASNRSLPGVVVSARRGPALGHEAPLSPYSAQGAKARSSHSEATARARRLPPCRPRQLLNSPVGAAPCLPL